MKPRVLFPLAATFSTCLFQERLLVSVTPRYLLASLIACSWSLWLSLTWGNADNAAFTRVESVETQERFLLPLLQGLEVSLQLISFPHIFGK